MFLRTSIKIRNKFFTLVFLGFLLVANDAVGAIELPVVEFCVKQDFLDEVKKTSLDQKNGMLIFPIIEDNTNNVQKLASGIFPTMTKYYDPSFIELVDILLGEESVNLKKLYRLYMKLADLINKVSAKDATAYNLYNCVYDCLIDIPESIKLGNEKNDWITKYENDRAAPGNKLNTELLTAVGRELSPFIGQYKDNLKLYYEKIIEIAPEEHKRFISDALNALNKINPNPMDFKKFMTSHSAEWLRNYAHTEDMLIYELACGVFEIINPQIFSLNDLCHICRKKFVQPSIKCLFPLNIVYCSVLKLKRPLPTTVDYVFSKQKFLLEPDHKPLPNICQIRIIDLLNYTQQWTVEFMVDRYIPQVVAFQADLTAPVRIASDAERREEEQTELRGVVTIEDTMSCVDKTLGDK